MTEKGLESLIVYSLIEDAKYIQGNPKDYNREYAIDLSQLIEFVKNTQPKAYEALSLETDNPRRTKFLHRLQGEIAKRGVVDVLRQSMTARLNLSYSMAHHRNKTLNPKNFTLKIFSVLPGNCNTAWTTPGLLLIWLYLLMVFRSLHLS